MYRIRSLFSGDNSAGAFRRMTVVAAALLVIAAPASAQKWSATLSGPAEAPPNASPGTGFALFELGGTPALRTLSVTANFSGLIGNTTIAHVHCCTAVAFEGTAGVITPLPTFPGFPAGVTSGSYSQVFDLTLATSYNPAFITANGNSIEQAGDALIASLYTGRAYFNLHSSVFPGGEIRGFITEVPEPGTFALMGVGLVMLSAAGARRRQRAS